jgi:hypothetical protein
VRSRLVARYARLVPVWLALMGLSCTRTSFTSTGPVDFETNSLPFVTIGPGGFNPQVLYLYTGRKVTVTNADSRPHEVFGARHPLHDEGTCPEMNIGRIEAGESKEIRWLHDRPVVCFYHDESAPDVDALILVY